MSLPNFLSIFRMCLVPIFVVFFFSNSPHAHLYSAIIFAVAGITDVADGMIARKFNLITNLGKILDPLADKLMTITVLICISIVDLIPWWIVLLIFAKDFILIIGGGKLYQKMSAVFQANIFGKIATFFLVVGGIAILLFESMLPASFRIVFAYCAASLSFLAFFSYLQQYLKFKKTHDTTSSQKKDW